MAETQKKSGRRLTHGVAITVVGLAHVGLFFASGLGQETPVVLPDPAPISVEFFRPSPPPPPPPPAAPSVSEPGGGAPAAPSRVNRVPDPPETPPELIAPPTPAPRPTLIVGASPTASLNAGLGQGGQGTGLGSGQGEGDGPGAGSGPMILRGASNGEILAFVPAEARRRRQAGRSAVNCVIRADTRLEACRVVDEQPGGLGFGDAAIRIAETYFRFRPPTTGNGRPVDGFRVTVTVNFGRQG